MILFSCSRYKIGDSEKDSFGFYSEIHTAAVS